MDDDRIIQAPDSTTPTRRTPVRSLAYFPGIRFDPNDGDGGSGSGDGDGESGEDGGAGGTGDGQDGGSTGGKTFDEAYVKGLRTEAAKHRTEAKTLREQLDELQKKDLTEKERAERERDEATKRAEAAEQRARRASARAAIAAAAVEAQAVDVATVQDLLSGKIEFDDDGEPVDVQSAVEQLLESKPFLRASGTGRSGEGAASGNGASDRGRGKLTIEQLRSMSPQEIQRLDQAEVDRVLAGG